jgi:hypothetical protein
MKNISIVDLENISPAILLAHTAKMSQNGFSKSHGQ